MEINIDMPIDNLIFKYNIDFSMPGYKKMILAKEIIAELGVLLRKKNNLLLLAQRQEEVNRFLGDIGGLPEQNVKAVVNKDISKMLESKELQEKNEVIVILSFVQHMKLTQQLYDICKIGDKTEIIDLYDYFIQRNLIFEKNYYSVLNKQDEYEEIYLDKKKYLQSEDRALKEFYLQKLIMNYLYIHDFYSSYIYIQEYIRCDFSEKERYQKFYFELINYVVELQNVVREKCNKNILIHWIDALEYDELQEMTFLSEDAQNSVFFENAYTVSPWTRATFKTMFCKRKMVDDHQFEMPKINKNNSILLRLIEQKGYNYQYIGHEKSDVFEKEYVATQYIPRPISSIYWAFIQNIVSSEKNTVYLLHSVYETHSPYINGLYEGNNYINGFERSCSKQQFEDGRTYVDNQLRFFSQFTSNVKCEIYMSDHGKIKDLYHTVLYVKKMEEKWNKKIDKMFTLFDFYELMLFIFEPTEEHLLEMFKGDIVQVQDSDKYGYTLYMRALLSGKSTIGGLLGYRGARSKEELFIRRNDGKESYFRLPQKENLIDDIRYKDRVSQLREFAGNYIIDVTQYEHFKVSQYIYKAIESYNKRISELKPKCETIILERIKKISDKNVIAIRGAGEHTKVLLKLIKDIVDVTYIVDRDKKQKKFSGIEIIDANEMQDKKIDTFILSSFNHRKEMKKELCQLNKDVEVIDFYELFEKEGMDLGQPYYGIEILEKIDCQNADFQRLGGSIGQKVTLFDE